MANVFEAGIEALLSAGEPLSAIIREFAEAIDSQDREACQLIREITEVYAEGQDYVTARQNCLSCGRPVWCER